MKNSTIRFVVILAALSIVGITITQIYWVRRAFDLKEAEFERTASSALHNVAQQIFSINKTPSPANNPVKQVSTNYFIVMVNGEIDANLLEYLLRNKNRVVSRVDIAMNVWDIDFDTNTNVIDVYINYVRNKVDKKFEKKLIHTQVGMGYILKD